MATGRQARSWNVRDARSPRRASRSSDVFNPERIVVGGSVARNQGERWLVPARERVAAVAFSVPRARVEIVPAELGDDVGLVGALPLLRRLGGKSKTGPASRRDPWLQRGVRTQPPIRKTFPPQIGQVP